MLDMLDFDFERNIRIWSFIVLQGRQKRRKAY